MDFTAWVADLAAGTVTHESGFVLQVEGDPRDPSAINPANFPANLSFVDQARLMRCGLEFLAKAAANNTSSYRSIASGVTDIESLKSEATKEREALAKQFAERTNKPERSVLSLKKNK
ncbi:hypothetical protein [Cellvibrio sp.]|uniref:hypothetical protein n=1 Tax=Cellvibrio sp. TaxID=1965322 RepID=UPI003964810F